VASVKRHGIRRACSGCGSLEAPVVLDQAVIALARHNTPNCKTKRLYFPFVENDKELRDTGVQDIKIGPLSDAAKKIINDIRPYPGGDDILVGLKELRNLDAHIELVPTSTQNLVPTLTRVRPGSDPYAVVGLRISGIMTGTSIEQGVGYEHGLEVDLASSGIPMADALRGSNEHIRLFPAISFAGTPVFDGQPVTPTLHEIAQRVETVLGSLERTI
jgi:hypothetical protein